MRRALLLLLALVVASSSSGCLMVVVKYPDGSDPPGEMKLQFRGVNTSSWSTMWSAGNVAFSCEPCFATPTPAPAFAELGPTLPHVTFTPRPTLVTYTPTPTPRVLTPTPSPTPTRSPTPVPTPSPTPLGGTPSPSPSPTPTPFGVTPTPTRTPTPRPTGTPQATPTPSASPTPTPKPGKIPCAGRTANGLPPGHNVAQPGTLPNLNNYIEWRISSETSPVSFFKVNARTTFRYQEVASSLNQSGCTGDDTSKLLVFYVPKPPGGYADDLIYHRCFRVNKNNFSSYLFQDTAFCTGSSGWETCNNNEARDAATQRIRPCSGRGVCGYDTCQSKPFSFNGSACCGCYVPNATATNAYGETVPIPNTDPSSPLVSKWVQSENGQWAVNFGWDFQAVGIPLGGGAAECCPACGGYAAGTKGACYCRLCSSSGGAAVGSGCANPPPGYGGDPAKKAGPWWHYANFLSVDQFGVTPANGITYADAAVSVDIKRVSYQEMTPIDGGLGPWDSPTATTAWISATWQQARKPGAKMPQCTPEQIPCQVEQSTPGDGTCNAWCDPGIEGRCYGTGSVCYSHEDCTGSPAWCQGGQSTGIQLSFGDGSEEVYGTPTQDSSNFHQYASHGPGTTALQYLSRVRFDSETLFFDNHYAPFSKASPTTNWTTYKFDLTTLVSLGKLVHVWNPWGCGGSTALGGDNYSGTCNFETEPTRCAKSCIAPGSVGHTGARCQNGGCYQFMFSELSDLSKVPVIVGFGLEGSWATKHVIGLKNLQLGTRTELLD